MSTTAQQPWDGAPEEEIVVPHTALCAEVEKLRRRVRAGSFRDCDLLETCWNARNELPEGDLHRLRIHTLAWEAHDACGSYKLASQCLHEDGIIDRGIEQIYEASIDPQRFLAAQFPADLSDEKRRARYDLWRQKAMGALASGFARYRLNAREYEQPLRTTQSFIEQCIVPAGFACNGTRARLHFFLGQVCEASYQHSQAAHEYDISLGFCIERANDHMQAGPGSPRV